MWSLRVGHLGGVRHVGETGYRYQGCPHPAEVLRDRGLQNAVAAATLVVAWGVVPLGNH